MGHQVRIGKFLVGDNYPCFIIAEAGVNHNGDLGMAFRLIDAAKLAGADAVKFQSFYAEDLVTPDAEKADYQIQTTGDHSSQFSMLKALEFGPDQHKSLIEYCHEQGILYLCTPYDKKSVDMLDEFQVSAYKIASTDTTNIPMLCYLAQKKRPVILSTGMCTLDEVTLAVETLRSHGVKDKIIILQCTSEYPAPYNELNLKAMLTMRQGFDCPVGFSDHTPGVGASPWAVAMGACVVEKHFTLDRNLPGPDHRASVEPHELKELVLTVRNVEAALGDGRKIPSRRELANKAKMQKSIVANRMIKQGCIIQMEDLICKRPATGLSPKMIDQVVGKRARQDIETNEPIKMEMLD